MVEKFTSFTRLILFRNLALLLEGVVSRTAARLQAFHGFACTRLTSAMPRRTHRWFVCMYVCIYIPEATSRAWPLDVYINPPHFPPYLNSHTKSEHRSTTSPRGS